MTNGQLMEMIIGAVCGFGSGLLFCGIGVWGERKKKPMNFWAGQPIDPKFIADLPGYNRACARLLKRFSIPCWIFGGLSLLLPVGNWTMIVGLVLLCLWGTVGLWWLIRSYKHIEKQYILKL